VDEMEDSFEMVVAVGEGNEHGSCDDYAVTEIESTDE
jgi:hypothetical protein